MALAVALLLSPPARGEGKLITLKQAYSLAMKSSPSIQMLKERVRQAEADRYKAWSPLKPTAGFQGTFTHFDQEIALDFPNPLTGQIESIVIQKQNQFAFNILAKLPLFVGPAYQGIGIAKKQVRLAHMSQIRSSQDFLLQVAAAYYAVVSQKEVVKALENKVTVDRKHLTAAKARFTVGQSARSVVLRADLELTLDEQKLRVARNSLKAARRQLGILIGTPGKADVQRPAEPSNPGGGGSRALVDAALQRRFDFKATRVAIDMAQQSRKAFWWGFLPTLDLTWMYRWSEAAGFADQKGMWSLVFTLNVPIYDGGARYADLRKSQAQIREANEQQRALAQKIESDIVKLTSDVESANAGVVSARKALELAKTTASDIEASFEAGVTTQLDVLDANQRLLDAELGLTSSLFQRDLARLSLTHALGKFDPIKSDS